MTPKLNKELSDALHASDNGEVQAIDPETNKMYVLVDGEVHHKAMDALRRQDDLAAIQEGIDDMEAGRGMPVEEADSRIREKLGFPSKS